MNHPAVLIKTKRVLILQINLRNKELFNDKVRGSFSISGSAV